MITLQRIKEVEVKDLPMHNLFALQEEIEAMNNELKSTKKILHDAFMERFSKKATANIRGEGREFGTTHLYEDNHCVTVTIPKKVEWDQEQLDSLMELISQEDRNKYFKITYDINEQKYLTHWPDNLKNIVNTARNISVGTPKFSIATKE